jgi:hydrogenase expression/formation protein HypC
MKIIRLLPDKQAVVCYEGVERQVSLRLMEGCKEGDYVLLHAGYAIERLSPEAAEENIHSFATMRKELGLE